LLRRRLVASGYIANLLVSCFAFLASLVLAQK